MSGFNRANNPSNYTDFINSYNSTMLLPTPTPQYLFARFAQAGRLSLERMKSGEATVQQYVSAAGGGAPVPPDMNQLALVADIYPGIVEAVDDWGKNGGDTIRFSRPVYSVGGLTEAAREVGHGAISTTGRTIQSEEGVAVLKQYHGPYASDGSAVAPFQIDNFDAQLKANRQQVTGLIDRALKNDYTSWLDTVIRDRFRVTNYTTLSDEGFADVASYTDGGGSGFNLDQLMRAKKALIDRFWQPFPNGRFICVVPTCFQIHMQADPDFRNAAQVHPQFNQLFGYIKSFENIDFYECSTTKQYAPAAAVLGDEAGTVPAGVTLEEALLIGPGAIGFGTCPTDIEGAMGPVCRFADDTNYGLNAKMIWLAVHCMATLDVRGCQRLIAQSDPTS